MAEIVPAHDLSEVLAADVVIVGAGAAGLIAALRARAAGAQVLVLERDAVPQGSTALSAGLIPAAETRFQRAAGLDDSRAHFAADILRKADHEPDAHAVAAVVEAVGPALEWLADAHGLPFSVISDFRYPGHSAYRMHGLPSRSGAELMDRLRSAAEAVGIDLLCNAHVTALLLDPANSDPRIRGVTIARPDGSSESIACNRLILACNGYGGNKSLLARYIPEIADAHYNGHAGNMGDAVLWGQRLGARVRHLSGYQGHGSVAHPHSILLTWAAITEGGIQVNLDGQRFHNEAKGYSEAAAMVLKQADRVAWTIFDGRIANIARQFEDFRRIETAGALLTADTIDGLAMRTRLPADALAATLADIAAARTEDRIDTFGRPWGQSRGLVAPYCAVRVTGALFHTQGGLEVDANARVLAASGQPLSNLYAVGGAACGVSGAQAHGYLSGNGLLTAVAYGYLAGDHAAASLTIDA